MSELLKDLRQAIVNGDEEIAGELARAALSQGITPLDTLNQAIVPGIEDAGRLWNENKYFLPDVILSAGAFKAALAEVQPGLEKGENRGAGRILMGVVAGDMHDLGKTIVIAMLSGAGFEVIDLGVDVSTETFIQKVKELEPDILGLGAYMSTTMLLMRDVVETLKAAGLRDKVRVMVGGVPTTQEFTDEIGADAWGKDALDAVDKARQLLEVKVL
jgi:5-methyltetrahydrofolate--homocysteine methyltransferase